MRYTYFISYNYSTNGGKTGFGSASTVRTRPLITCEDMEEERVYLRDTPASKNEGITNLVILGVFLLSTEEDTMADVPVVTHDDMAAMFERHGPQPKPFILIDGHEFESIGEAVRHLTSLCIDREGQKEK